MAGKQDSVLSRATKDIRGSGESGPRAASPFSAPATMVAIREPIPSLLADVEDALRRAGATTCRVDRLEELSNSRSVELAICHVADREVSRLADLLERRSSLRVIVLHDQTSAVPAASFLGAGAASVLPRGSSARVLVLSLELVALGHVVLPQISPGGGVRLLARLTEEELGWLSMLATDLTVAEVALRWGYSEREFHRRLRRLYGVLGVGGRLQAAVLFSHCGLLDPRGQHRFVSGA